MPVTPSGIIGLPRLYLLNLIAASAAFQAWTGTASAALAKDRIHYSRAPDVSATRPYVVIGGNPLNAESISSPSGVTGSGSIPILFVDAYIAANVPEDELNTFDANVGGVVSDMFALKHTSPGGDQVLFFDSMEQDGDTEISHDDDNANVARFMNAVWNVNYNNAIV